jgi:hypothetical protein
MSKKIEFNIIYLNIRCLDLPLFRKEILIMFNDHVNYDFKTNCIYYIHLINLYDNNLNGNILTTIPFKLTSKTDDEEFIEELYFELYPYLENFLSKNDNPYPN